MPLVRVTTTHTVQIRAGTLGTPLERMVINKLAGHRIMPIALGFGTEGPDHLRMAKKAAFANINVAPGQAHRIIRFQALHRGGRRTLKKQRDNLQQTTDADHQYGQQHQQADVTLNGFL